MEKFVANKLFGQFVTTEAFPDKSHHLQRIGDCFTVTVDFLRDPEKFPNTIINSLMALVWDIVGKRMVPVTITNAVPTPGFFVEKSNGQLAAMIMLPVDWFDTIRNEPLMANGAVIMCGSKTVDFYNSLFEGKLGEGISKRAAAYEAEFLLTCLNNKQIFGEITLNQYQEQVLKFYPQGWNSLDSKFKYESKPFVKGEISAYWNSVGKADND